MSAETKQCQNCKNDFIIEDEDFGFYEKIQVPPPTFCPKCRLIRRMTWRNDSNLYKKKDIHGHEIFSAYSPDSPVKIMERDEWWQDGWNPTDYARDYDFDRPFFQQFKELLYEVPLASRAMNNPVRSDYCMNASDLKECYLTFGAFLLENCYYVYNSSSSQDCFDSEFLIKCQRSYGSFYDVNCYQDIFCKFCEDCQNIWFCRDCVGCSDCFGCTNLRQKQCCLFNEQLTKEEYKKRVAEFDLGSYENLQRMQDKVMEIWNDAPVKYMRGSHNYNVTGEYIDHSKNCQQCYHIYGGENLKYCQHLYGQNGGSNNSYDVFRFGDALEECYETVVSGHQVSRLVGCWQCFPGSSELYYCAESPSSHQCFGCVGMKKGNYCILNKQYSKEEYEKLVFKIKQHMNDMPYVDTQGNEYRFGEFFPSELSPFEYNISVAHEFYPLEESVINERGLGWYKEPKQDYPITMHQSEIPDHIDAVDDSIVKEVIASQADNKAFRIMPAELHYLKAVGLPLPHVHPDGRHKIRRDKFQQSYKLHKRTTEDGVDVMTSYAPDRPEKIYSEEGYNNLVN